MRRKELAALRHEIGDPLFFKLMRTWATDHRFGNVTTQDFTDLANKISGQNLDNLFKAWLWDQTKPPKI